MIVNTLIKSNDHEKFRCMGYSSPKTLLPRHLFQSADDSASQHQLKRITNCS